MEYLVKNKKLELKYAPGKGAWTYHIQVPNTKHIVGKWGSMKVSGTVDDYKLEAKNLFTITGQDKLISINAEIRKAIQKAGGDMVTVTLFLLPTGNAVSKKDILETLKESNVLQEFQKLSQKEKSESIKNIMAQKTEESQTKSIAKLIDKLGVDNRNATNAK